MTSLRPETVAWLEELRWRLLAEHATAALVDALEPGQGPKPRKDARHLLAANSIRRVFLRRESLGLNRRAGG